MRFAVPAARARRRVARALPERARRRLRNAAEFARARRHADFVVASGLFDPQWYAAQAGCPADPVPAARHYLRDGARTGHSPHPLFDAEYVTERNVSMSGRNPLLAYLTVAGCRTTTTHRLFDLEHYLAEHPEAADHRLGPVAYYATVGVSAGHSPNTWFVAGPDEPGGLSDWLRARHQESAARERTTESRWTDRPPLWEGSVGPGAEPRSDRDQPLVSVVLPLGAALTLARSGAEAVLAQTLNDLELIVVHPAGAAHATRLALGPVADDRRLRLVEDAVRSGSPEVGEVDEVATGIAAARGAWLAFCRPSARWQPHHLATVVGHASAEGAGFDVVERSESDGKRRWSTGEATPARSLVRPQIEPSALVVRRDRLAECGGFDAALRRGAWYDLELRLGALAPVALVPRVGVVDEAALRKQQDDSVPRRERPRQNPDHAESWVNVAVERRLVHWDRLDAGGDPATVSVIIPTYADSELTVRAVECVHRARAAHPDGPAVEVVVIDNGCRARDAVVLDSLARRFPGTLVHHEPVNRGFSTGNNIGLGITRGSTVVFLNNDTEVDEGWLGPLVSALQDPEVHGAQSLLVYPSGSIQSAGIAFPTTGGIPHVFLQGFPVADARGVEQATLYAATAAALAMRRRDVVALHGFDPLFRNGMEDVDLGLRSMARRPGRFTVRPDSVVVHHESRTPDRFRYVSVNRRILLDRHGASMPGDDVRLWASQGYDVVGHHVHRRPRGDHRLDSPEPVLAHRPLAEVRDGTPRLRWAVKDPAPYRPDAPGDAHRLAAALERLGQQVILDSSGEFERDTGRFDDVVLVLRGPVAYEPVYGQVSIAWLVSHPESLSRREAQAYDRVFAADEAWAERTSREWDIRIDPLPVMGEGGAAEHSFDQCARILLDTGLALRNGRS